ncbi:hypothetical protein DB42_AK00830 [Neochlamydia sp. EPS4]|nr:hypothetical protein DB42_AK00830 [Neochlamydia sp. EPS4]
MTHLKGYFLIPLKPNEVVIGRTMKILQEGKDYRFFGLFIKLNGSIKIAIIGIPFILISSFHSFKLTLQKSC